MEGSSLEQLLENGQVWLAETQAWSASKLPKVFQTLQKFPAGDLQLCAKFGVPEIDDILPNQGLRYGAIHEFFSINKIENSDLEKYPICTLPSLIAGSVFEQSSVFKQSQTNQSRAAPRYTIWIGRESWPSPFLLKKIAAASCAQNLIQDFIEFCIFTDPLDLKTKLWAIEAALKTPGIGTVITSLENLRFTLSRRLALAAEEGNSLGIFLRKKKDLKTPGAALTRWGISVEPSTSGSPRWKLELLKCKGKQPAVTEWLVELRDEKAISLHIPSGVVDKSVLPAVSRPERRQLAG
jgi:hypothetical protein